MITIQDYHRAAREKGATDFYLSVGSRPWLKIRGRLRTLAACPPVTDQQMQDRNEIKFRGSGTHDLGDQKNAEWMTNITRDQLERSDMRWHEENAFPI